VNRLEVTKLPDYSFLRGIAYQDVVRLRLLSSEEKKKRKWGDPDVEIRSLWYKNINIAINRTPSEYITRAVANQKFFTTDGRKLSSRFLKTNKNYIVTSKLNNIPVYVLPPSGKHIIYTINGQDLPQDVYTVFASDDENHIIFEIPVTLKHKYFKIMIRLTESTKDLKKRVRRYDTAAEDRKEAQYRVVAMAVDKRSNQKLGYIVSYLQETGEYKEQFCSMKKIVELLENNNIRNMKIVKNMHGQKEESLIYGRLIELPTHFIDMSKQQQKKNK
jgi:hypothetical protein